MTRTAKRTRRGFTLVELLVVILIISVLVSLTAVGVFRLMGAQQNANTKSELTRVEDEFLKIYRAEVDKISKETGPQTNFVLTQAGGDAGRAKVIYIKLRLAQTFPQTFAEAISPPAPLQADPYYHSVQNTGVLDLAGYNATNTTTPQPWESSALLLLALQRGVDGNGVKPEDLGVSSFVHNYPTPNGGTIQGLVDGWGNPLRFCRWPVYSTQLNPGGQPQAGDNNDPVDPSGLLESTSWQQTAGYTWFVQTCHPVPQHPAGQAATSYRVYPLIVSAGPDGKLGLDKEPPPPTPPPLSYYFATLPANQGGAAAADNLYPTLATAK